VKKLNSKEALVSTHSRALVNELSLELANGSPPIKDYTPSIAQVDRVIRRVMRQLDVVHSGNTESKASK
jgi:hypothetical protein